MPFPKIAVIGAGPAGLTLARILQYNSVPCVIFDLDADRHARTQGGTLDLHESSGQAALREAGLHDEFLKHAHPEGEFLKIYEPSGQVLMDENKGVGTARPETFKNRPEIDRVLLRAMLLDSLEEGSVKWGKKLLRVDVNEDDETYDLHFADGQPEEGFDIVVGADGAWSKVRPLVSDAVPFYSGIAGLDVKISNANERHPELGERVGGGMCLTLGPNKGILAQRNGDGAIRVYAFMRTEETWDKESGVDFAQIDSAKRQIVDMHFGDWDQGAKDMVLKSDPELMVRHMYMLPIGLRWKARPGVTLIGDAAHLMTPFAGVGVNVALEDALHLARNIIARKGDWNVVPQVDGRIGLATALKEYEEAMFVRAEEFAKQTWMYLCLFFHERGGIAMVEHFEQTRAQHKTTAEEKGAAVLEALA